MAAIADKPDERTAPDEAPFVPQAEHWRRWPRAVIELGPAFVRTPADAVGALWIGVWAVVSCGWLVLAPLERALRDQEGVGPALAWAMTIVVLLMALAALIGPESVCAVVLRRKALERRRRRVPIPAAAAGLIAIVVLCWITRPLFHGPLMLLYQYPLVTWIPLAAGFAAAAIAAAIARHRHAGADAALQAAISIRMPVTVVLVTVFMIMLPSWQGRALYKATSYETVVHLPAKTQPRLLPKSAAVRTAGVRACAMRTSSLTPRRTA